ncbi:hypothetical protein ACHQM5_012489 [Ranunculus cassubicifolius]
MEKTQSERSVNFSPHSTEEDPKPDSAGVDSANAPPVNGDSPRSLDVSRKSDGDGSQEKENRNEEETEKKESKEEEISHSHHHRLSSNDVDTNLLKLSEEVDSFLTNNLNENQEIPESIEKFAKLVQVEIVKCVSGDVSSLKLFDEADDGESPSILESIERISKLTTMLADFKADKDVIALVNLTSTVLQRAMSFLEEELRTILDVVPSKTDVGSSSRKTTSGSFKDPDRCTFNPQADKNDSPDEDNFPGFSMETVTNLKKIASAMIASGYGTECCQIYNHERRNAFEDKLMKIGYEKISIDDVQKMSWESLEGEISTWIKVMKQAVDVYFPAERKLCEQIFGEKSGDIFHSLTRNIALQLLNFAEAVAMTKRSAEKLFKFLDTYETVRDVIPTLNELFEDDTTHNMKMETQSARYRLGEAACLIFCDLENSIKSDTGKTPVPGGAVHPLTRYTINYVKYACEYKDTLEQVFYENRNTAESANDTSSSHEESSDGNNPPAEDKPSPFSEQLMTVMDLLDSNLEGKSKLYKDQSLSYIFLMNNGRYIMQKIKESGEIYQLLGNTWSRKRSSDLRQYHKNYQRETWSKVLGCLSHEGLQVNGKVQKPVLKERFKNFNALFDEIHKTQSTWIVSDNQLQSELQVSICAVVVPAYRAFLGRFEQYLDAGRQTEKYIKFGSEDIETAIDDLFNGNQSFAARKNNK